MMASRDEHSRGLHVGSTGTFSVISEDVRRREYTVSLRDSSGAEVGTCKGSFDDLQEEVVRPEDVLTLYEFRDGLPVYWLREEPHKMAPLKDKKIKGGSKVRVVSWKVVNRYIKVCYDEAGSEAAVISNLLHVGWIAIKHVVARGGQPYCH